MRYLCRMQSEKRAYNRIKVVLAMRRVTSKALAAHLGVTVQTVSKWCTNYSQPSIPELYAVAEFLGATVFDLLEPSRPAPLSAPEATLR